MSACSKPKRRNLARSRGTTTISFKLWSSATIIRALSQFAPSKSLDMHGQLPNCGLAKNTPWRQTKLPRSFHAIRRDRKPHLSNVACIRSNRFRLSLKACLVRPRNAPRASQSSGAVLPSAMSNFVSPEPATSIDSRVTLAMSWKNAAHAGAHKGHSKSTWHSSS